MLFFFTPYIIRIKKLVPFGKITTVSIVDLILYDKLQTSSFISYRLICFQCSVSCNHGIRSRAVKCMDRATRKEVDIRHCQDERPRNTRRCYRGRCPRWRAGRWGKVRPKKNCSFIYPAEDCQSLYRTL